MTNQLDLDALVAKLSDTMDPDHARAFVDAVFARLTEERDVLRAALEKWARRADHGYDPEENEASVDYWRGVRAVTTDALARTDVSKETP